jgi:hypothetical protein
MMRHGAGRRYLTSNRSKGISLRVLQLSGALLLVIGAISAVALIGTAGAGTGVGASGNTVPGAAAAQGTFTANSPFDSGQHIDVVIPLNSVLTPGATLFVLECAAPNGVNPTNTSSCDGNTGYDGGTISVNSDGSVDVTGGSAPSGLPYKVFALPDHVSLGEGPAGVPKCGLGAANECVLYIGQGGGSDPGMSQPHFFSQPFQVHTDPTDSGTLSPGDGSPALVTPVSPTLSTVAPATQSATADGADPATVTVTLNDSGSAGVPGKLVTLTAAAGTSTVTPASPGSDTTDASGKATFHVTDATAETATYHATDTTDTISVTQTAQVTFAAPTVNQGASSVMANPTAVATGTSTPSTITVTLKDNSVHGSPAPLAGRTVTVVGMSGGSVVVPASSGSNVTNAGGVATFLATDTANEAVTYKATDTTDSVQLTTTATVTFGSATLTVSASASTVTASPSAALTGSGAGTTVTVTLLTAGSTPVPNKSVTLSPSGAATYLGIPSGTTTSVTDSTGQAKFTVTDLTAESVTITATDTTDTLPITATATVVFSLPPPPTISPTASTVTVSSSPAPADGFSQALISVTVTNTAGQPVAGVMVTVTGNPSTSVLIEPSTSDQVPGVTDSSGGVHFSARDTVAETVTVSAVAGVTATSTGVPLSTQPTITFTAGTADAGQSTVAASPLNVAADGTAASTVTVTLTDHSNNGIVGKTITLMPSGGSSVIAPPMATTDTHGVATFSVTDAKTEVVTYTATDTSDALPLFQLATVTFGTPPPVIPAQGDSTAVTNASSVAGDGTTAATIKVELRDANGMPVTGKTVALSASGGSSVITVSAATPFIVTPKATPGVRPRAASGSTTTSTNSNGNAYFDVTDKTAEVVTYTATDTTDSTASLAGWTVAVTFTAATATTSTTTTTPASTTTTTTAPTAPASGASGGATPTDTSSSGTSGSGSSGSGSGSGPSLAFTGAPGALPWLFGLGFLCLLLGTFGRRALVVRRRDR